MESKLIWCEVSCGHCGAVAAASGYYSPERIKNLKASTKGWKDDSQYRVLCPECYAKLRVNEKKS